MLVCSEEQSPRAPCSGQPDTLPTPPHIKGSSHLSALDAHLSSPSDVRGFVLTLPRATGASQLLQGAQNELGPWELAAGLLFAQGQDLTGVFCLGQTWIRPARRFCGSICSSPRGKGVVNAEIPCFVHLLVVYCVITLPIGVWEEY